MRLSRRQDPDRDQRRNHGGLSSGLPRLVLSRDIPTFDLPCHFNILNRKRPGFRRRNNCDTKNGSGESLPGKAYKEYKLGSYSEWLQKIVNETQNWNTIKTYLVDTKICNTFNNKYLNDTVQKFYKERLNSIQSGCCKPSDECGFTYRSLTNWTEEEKGDYRNPDCKAWDNNPKVLCFNCQSCKAAWADNIKHAWKKGSHNQYRVPCFPLHRLLSWFPRRQKQRQRQSY